MHFLLRTLPRLRLGLHFILLLLIVQPLLPVLQTSPLPFLLSDVSLNTEHQQYLLPQLIEKVHVLFSRYDLIRYVHA